MTPGGKRALRVGLGAGVILLMVFVRVVYSSHHELALAEGQSGKERMFHLGMAARMSAPLNPYAGRALAELREMAQKGPDSLTAWRTIRSAILSARSFYTPHRELLDEANQQIATLMAAAETDGSRDWKAWHLARLQKDDAPSVGWSVVALLGLGAWLGSAVLFILRGLDEKSRIVRKPALTYGMGVLIGLVMFFLGLSRA